MSLNPILEALNQQGPTARPHTMQTNQQDQLSQIQEAYNLARQLTANGVQPVQALATLASQNPEYTNVYNLVQQNGGNLQASVMQLAQQKGIDTAPLQKMCQSILT